MSTQRLLGVWMSVAQGFGSPRSVLSRAGRVVGSNIRALAYAYGPAGAVNNAADMLARRQSQEAEVDRAVSRLREVDTVIDLRDKPEEAADERHATAWRA